MIEACINDILPYSRENGRWVSARPKLVCQGEKDPTCACPDFATCAPSPLRDSINPVQYLTHLLTDRERFISEFLKFFGREPGLRILAGCLITPRIVGRSFSDLTN